MLATKTKAPKRFLLGDISRGLFGLGGDTPWHLLLSSDYLRRKLLSYADEGIRSVLLADTRFPPKVQEDKYHLARNLLETMDRIFRTSAPAVRRSLVDMLINHAFRKEPTVKRFRDEFGRNPPAFLVISPGRFCNLQCQGCYAGSSSGACERLPWDVLDRLVEEKTRLWGSYLTVISGGEPLLYRDRGLGILDLAAKHPDNYFLMYTNGTLIDEERARRIASLGNLTPAISVEGFERETDARRGLGVHARIRKAMRCLRDAGVPFGISVTASRANAELAVSDELMDYYMGELGASYAWIFQLMPIGRAGDLDLMITPWQRERMYRQTQRLVRDRRIFVVDFWNSGCATNGCISAGRQEGYLYVDWSGNVTPCVFNPYSPVNIKDVYMNGGDLNGVLRQPFFAALRQWQDEYALKRPPEEMGNWLTPCAIRDHYGMLKELLGKHRPKPIDPAAKLALDDLAYARGLEAYGQAVADRLDPIWEKEYLGSLKAKTP